jgi:hypothetical protein
MNTKEHGDGIDGWSGRQFDHYVREPFWKSVPFLLLAAMLAIDVVKGLLVAYSSWAVLDLRTRFLLVFLIGTSPLILFAAVQQQRFVRGSVLPAEAARRILALTFVIATWSYALIGIALQLLRLVSRRG